MSEAEDARVWEFLKALGDPGLSFEEVPYPPPDLRDLESEKVSEFVAGRTPGVTTRGLGLGQITTPYWEARKVYGDGTARMLVERGREFAENPPDVPQHVLENVIPPPHDAESTKRWGAPVPLARMAEGWGFDGSSAVASATPEEDNPEGLPVSVILPTEGSRYDDEATTAHELTHAGSKWGGDSDELAIDQDKLRSLRGSLAYDFRRRTGDSFTRERLSSYLRGVNYILRSSSEAAASLSGAVRNYGSVHGRPPATEEEVEEAIIEEGALRSESSEGEHPDLEDGITDALLKLPWTRKIGKHLVISAPLEGGESYV